MTMARTLKLYKLPDQPATPGLRQMEDKDVPQVGGACLWATARREAPLQVEGSRSHVLCRVAPLAAAAQFLVVGQLAVGRLSSCLSCRVIAYPCLPHPRPAGHRAAGGLPQGLCHCARDG